MRRKGNLIVHIGTEMKPGKILVCDDRYYTSYFQRLAFIYVFHNSVSILTADHDRVQHAGKVDIRSVPGCACDFVDRPDVRYILADKLFIAHNKHPPFA